MPARPSELRLDGVDPCALLTPAQFRQLGMHRGERGEDVDELGSSDCLWRNVPDASAADGTVRLWNVADPARPVALGSPLTGHHSVVTGVGFSPDGRTLASTGWDGTVRVWNLDLDQAIQRICATTGNTLTPEKWRQHIGPDVPYGPACP